MKTLLKVTQRNVFGLDRDTLTPIRMRECKGPILSYFWRRCPMQIQYSSQIQRVNDAKSDRAATRDADGLAGHSGISIAAL